MAYFEFDIAALFYLVHDAAEQRELIACILLAVLARLVGHGEVRIHALALDARQRAGTDDVVHALLEVRPVAEKAEAGHARIELYVYLQRLSKAHGLRRILQRLGKAGHGLGDVLLDEHGGVLVRRMAEDEYRHCDSAAAQLQRLVKAGHGEVIRALSLQKPRDRQCAVTVRVRLHNAEKAAAIRQGRADGAVIVPQILKVYFRPCSLL